MGFNTRQYGIIYIQDLHKYEGLCLKKYTSSKGVLNALIFLNECNVFFKLYIYDVLCTPFVI